MALRQPIPSPSKKAMKDLANIHDPAILLDSTFQILAANEAYQEELGGEKSLEGLHCYEVSHGFDRPCDEAGECCPLKASMESEHAERMLHVHQSTKGCEFVDVEIRPIRDRRGKARYYLEILRPTLVASAEPTPVGLVGKAPAFNQMLELVQRVAKEQTTVLLLGESGTGKELISRAIHEGSDRSKKPFVPVECSGLADNLFESELFGHKKGAFTGAYFDKPGLIEAAHGGTLFLDEIGEVSAQIQVKLLRLLETQTFRRVGSTEAKYVDFRLICATNRNLAEMVKTGLFRKDLYYRISIFPIQLPALRDRREDIGLLANSLLRRYPGKKNYSLSKEALSCLGEYAFPGNIRELQNLLERARILASGHQLKPMHFPGICGEAAPVAFSQAHDFQNHTTDEESLFQIKGVQTLEAVEALYMRHILATFPGKREALAKKLGISLRTLVRKIKTAKA
ncbi:MAG: sigma 54-interacting transcriptional regulator [Magnetococcales bacterium]|nr:sigma 54-interacting transcriptional regulator [Magnetococcales bacterium]